MPTDTKTEQYTGFAFEGENLIRDWQTGLPLTDQNTFTGNLLMYGSDGRRIVYYMPPPNTIDRKWIFIREVDPKVL